jgi:hypothetical protein
VWEAGKFACFILGGRVSSHFLLGKSEGYELIIHLDSPPAAKKELDFWIGKAIKIIDREHVKGKDGAEERAVITVDGKPCKESTIIMETDKTILHLIQSCSAQTALDFETEFKSKTNPVHPKPE